MTLKGIHKLLFIMAGGLIIIPIIIRIFSEDGLNINERSLLLLIGLILLVVSEALKKIDIRLRSLESE